VALQKGPELAHITHVQNRHLALVFRLSKMGKLLYGQSLSYYRAGLAARARLAAAEVYLKRGLENLV